MLKLYLLFWIVTIACGSDSDPTQLEAFFGDIIDTWHIASPTIIAQDSLPALCMRHQWVLCLSSEMEREDVMEHLTVMHQTRKQDGVILDGNEGHEGLLKKLVDVLPSLFSSKSPVFMPREYTNFMRLRLDSNVIFYHEMGPGMYSLIDTFAVKGGPPINIELGEWNVTNGIRLFQSIYRWDRRTDLKGATFINGLGKKGILADFVRDD